MKDVAADRDLEPLDLAKLVAQSKKIEQRLGRMLVLPVARIDHVRPDPLPQNSAEPRRGGGSPPCRSASPRGSGPCPPVSPLETEPEAATFTVSAERRFSANSKEIRVLVEASKNRLTMVFPRRPAPS